MGTNGYTDEFKIEAIKLVLDGKTSKIRYWRILKLPEPLFQHG